MRTKVFSRRTVEGARTAAIVAALAFATAGCIVALASCRATPVNDAVIAIANRSTAEAAFQWQSSTFYAREGTEPIPPCSQYLRGFEAGHHEIIITAGIGGQLELSADFDQRSGITRWFVIEQDGRIHEVSEGWDPTASPFCG